MILKYITNYSTKTDQRSAYYSKNKILVLLVFTFIFYFFEGLEK